MAVTPLDIAAEVRGLDPADPDALTTVRGQVEVATTDRPGARRARWSRTTRRPARRRSPRSRDADWVVLGPGSWFTSVIPHLLVPELRRGAGRDRGPHGGDAQPGAAGGGDRRLLPETHLEVLAEHAPDLRLDVVLADARRGAPTAPARAVAAALGAELVVADLAVGDGTPRHDPAKLADAYAGCSREA